MQFQEAFPTAPSFFLHLNSTIPEHPAHSRQQFSNCLITTGSSLWGHYGSRGYTVQSACHLYYYLIFSFRITQLFKHKFVLIENLITPKNSMFDTTEIFLIQTKINILLKFILNFWSHQLWWTRYWRTLPIQEKQILDFFKHTFWSIFCSQKCISGDSLPQKEATS